MKHDIVSRTLNGVDAVSQMDAIGKVPGVMAQEASQSGALFVHYSTDYVYDGEGSRPWRETDPE